MASAPRSFRGDAGRYREPLVRSVKGLIGRYDILITVFFFLLAIPAEYSEVFSAFEDQTVSLRHTMRSGVELDQNIVFVSTDEEFFQAYAQLSHLCWHRGLCGSALRHRCAKGPKTTEPAMRGALFVPPASETLRTAWAPGAFVRI